MLEREIKAKIESLSPKERRELLSWLREVVLEEQKSEKKLSIVFDGGSRGNPGAGYGSYAIMLAEEPPIVNRIDFDEVMTNNEAEYRTLIEALKGTEKFLLERKENPKTWSIDIAGDSRLVINQVLGSWAAREPRLAALRDEVRYLMKKFGSVTLRHHPRSESVKALGH